MRYSARLRVPADFGLAVQQARLAQGLTQQELARVLGVHQSTVSEMESGHTTIYVRRLLAFAKATGLEFTASWDSEDDTSA